MAKPPKRRRRSAKKATQSPSTASLVSRVARKCAIDELRELVRRTASQIEAAIDRLS
jgi:hypothetical protein